MNDTIDTGATTADEGVNSGRIFVAGHRGMVGSAIVRALAAAGDADVVTQARAELDLTDGRAVERFFDKQAIGTVYLAAAKVGGIHANDTYPADFIFDNLAIQLNVIDAARRSGVPRLLFLGSSCIYPRLADQPIGEEALLSGALESTNEPYAVAKIAGIKLCESCNRQYGTDYRSVMPTNLYGPGDNFHSRNSHVIPALMRRFHEAKVAAAPEVEVWGSGRAMREFLHVEDLADACLHVMGLTRARLGTVVSSRVSHVNVGTGLDCTISELAETIARVVGYEGRIVWDVSKPDGAPRKLLDVHRLARLGWRARIDLDSGLATTYEWYLEHLASNTLRIT